MTIQWPKFIRRSELFWELQARTASGFKNQSHFFGVARSTYVGPPFRNTSRVGGGVEIKKLPFSF
jgi:hypothetical protein